MESKFSEMMDFYNKNKDFKLYVNLYANKYNEGKSISVNESLEHELVKQVAEQYREKEETRVEIKRD